MQGRRNGSFYFTVDAITNTSVRKVDEFLGFHIAICIFYVVLGEEAWFALNKLAEDMQACGAQCETHIDTRNYNLQKLSCMLGDSVSEIIKLNYSKLNLNKIIKLI